MASTGAVVNANAGRTRRDPGLVSRLQRLLGDGGVRVTRSPAEVGPALDALREAGARCLLVVGGDGSVGGTLTELVARWPAASWPDVMITAGGTVNTIAKSLGAHGAPDAAAARLLASGPRQASLRPLVEVHAPDGGVRRGMIFANGVAVRWLRMYYEESQRGVAGAASVVARIAASAAVRGALAKRIFSPADAEVEIDDEAPAQRRFTVMAAASVTHIGLGFRPFTLAGRYPDRFHFALTRASALRICGEMPAARLGRVPRNTTIESRAARGVRLTFPEPQPWSLDADVYPATNALVLRATAPLRFLSA